MADKFGDESTELGFFTFKKSDEYGLNFDDFNTSVVQISPNSGDNFYLKGNKLCANDVDIQVAYEVEFSASSRYFFNFHIINVFMLSI